MEVMSAQAAPNGSLSDAPASNELSPDEIKLLQDYSVWKKNSPYLYDTMVSASLPWPSLTAQFFPDVAESSDSYNFRVLLGTRTAGQGDEFLRIANVKLPKITDDKLDLSHYDPERGELGGYTSSVSSKVDIVHKIDHSGEVNRARFMPQNPDILATFSSNGSVYVFDRTKHSLQPKGHFSCEVLLEYHTNEGYGLSWSPYKEGQLLTGSSDNSIALWDLQQFNSEKRRLSPLSTFTDSQHVVNEVEWAPLNEHIFGSVSDLGRLAIHDLRSPSNDLSVTLGEPHAMNTLAFNKANEYLVATGSVDQSVKLWDIRKLPANLHSMTAHSDAVMSLEWSPHFPTILASTSSDRRALIWDIAKMGEVGSSSSSSGSGPNNDGQPPELLFMHGGHMGAISDVSWNPHVPWMLATVSEDNHLHIWRPADTLVAAH